MWAPIKENDDSLLLLAEKLSALQASREHSIESSKWAITSFGWHDHQLFPEEFFAFINFETAANLNLGAEARGRPRKSLLDAAADLHDENDMGCRAETVDVEDENPGPDIQADSTVQPSRSDGVVYTPLQPVHLDDLFKTVHRWKDGVEVDGRTSNADKLAQTFQGQHQHEYDALKKPRTASCSFSILASDKDLLLLRAMQYYNGRKT